MNLQAEQMVALRRILERAGLSHFLADTARFYESSLVVLDRDGGEVLREGGGDGSSDEAGEVRRPVDLLGSTVGYVIARPRRPEDAVAAAALAEHAGRLLGELALREYELNDLSQEILDSYEEVNLFYDVSSAVGQVRDVEGVCRVILAKACEIISVDRASILLLDPRSEELRLVAARGIPEEDWEGVRLPVGEGVSGKVLASRTPQLVDDVGHLPRGQLAGYERYVTRSFISVPLCVEMGSPGAGGPEVLEVGGDAWVARRGAGAIGVMNMTDRRDRREFTSGDLKLLTALATQAAVIIENMRLVSLEKELRIARRIQESLLPEAPPRVQGLDLAGHCQPARNVGGDYYDFLVGKSGRIAAVVADVSGHNIASAIMMAVARSAVRRELVRSERPAEVLLALNSALFEDLTRAELFLSALCVVYEPSRGELRYASAGHPPALLMRPGEECRQLDAEGLLTGVLESVGYEERRVRIRPGDVVLLYTDGIVEASSAQGEFYGLDRLKAALRHLPGESAERIKDELLRSVRSFCGGRPQEDDITLVVLKALAPGGR